jgi:hypothetical protein
MGWPLNVTGPKKGLPRSRNKLTGRIRKKHIFGKPSSKKGWFS